LPSEETFEDTEGDKMTKWKGTNNDLQNTTQKTCSTTYTVICQEWGEGSDCDLVIMFSGHWFFVYF